MSRSLSTEIHTTGPLHTITILCDDIVGVLLLPNCIVHPLINTAYASLLVITRPLETPKF